ncbi:MAG: ribonuclease H-like domain-containing protein [Blautia sp.]
MLTIISDTQHLYTNHIALFFSDPAPKESFLFFDIETTGLSHKNSFLSMIGAAIPKEHTAELYQFLAEKETPEEEQALLRAFASLCREKTCLVHFNGTTFDLPYLRHKYREHAIASPLEDKTSLDLYKALRPLSSLFPLPDFRQKSLESLCGYKRTDTLSGKELIKIYHSYANSGNPREKELLLLHNHDDVEGMLALTSLGVILACLKGRFTLEHTETLQTRTLEGLFQQEVLFSLLLPASLPVPLSFSLKDSYITIRENSCKIKMPLLEGTLKYFYPDYKNYYYLPLEDEAIHKSVGMYVDKDCRERAKASNCCKRISGYFLKADGTPSLPLLKESYEAKQVYIQWTEDFIHSKSMQEDFLKSFLSL